MQGNLISDIISLVNASLSLSSEGLDLHDHTQTRLYVTSPQTREGKLELAEGRDLTREQTLNRHVCKHHRFYIEPESNDNSEQSSFS